MQVRYSGLSRPMARSMAVPVSRDSSSSSGDSEWSVACSAVAAISSAVRASGAPSSDSVSSSRRRS